MMFNLIEESSILSFHFRTDYINPNNYISDLSCLMPYSANPLSKTILSFQSAVFHPHSSQYFSIVFPSATATSCKPSEPELEEFGRLENLVSWRSSLP